LAILVGAARMSTLKRLAAHRDLGNRCTRRRQAIRAVFVRIDA